MCRRASGAVALTFVIFPSQSVTWLAPPARYDSSAFAWRQFCADCGTPLAYNFRERPETVAVTLGSLDHPERAPAHYSIWLEDRLPWLKLDDHLPGFPRWRFPPTGQS